MKNLLWLYYWNSIKIGILSFVIGGILLLFSFYIALMLLDLVFVGIFFWSGVIILGLAAIGTLTSLIAELIFALQVVKSRHRGHHEQRSL